MAIEPFSSTALTDNGGNAAPEATVELDVVPAGKLLVVEHVSEGWPYATATWWSSFKQAPRGRIQSPFSPLRLYRVRANSAQRKGSVVGISSAHPPGSMWARETNSSSLAEQTRHSGCSPRLSGIWSMSEHCYGARLKRD
jgi:hypothetical protein